MAKVTLVRYFNCPRTFRRNKEIFRLSVSLSDGVSLTHWRLYLNNIQEKCNSLLLQPGPQLPLAPSLRRGCRHWEDCMFENRPWGLELLITIVPYEKRLLGTILDRWPCLKWGYESPWLSSVRGMQLWVISRAPKLRLLPSSSFVPFLFLLFFLDYSVLTLPFTCQVLSYALYSLSTSNSITNSGSPLRTIEL